MKKFTSVKGKRVLVIGLAKSGMAAVKALQKLGAVITVNDRLPYQDNIDAQALYKEGIQVVCGSHPVQLTDHCDFIVKNPGIPYQNPIIEAAQEKGIPVWTEVELAYHLSEAPIVAVTGSNGKTTTTTLIHEMLLASGVSSRIAGNIGTVAVDVAQEATADDVIVMELSSFQLAGTEAFRPHAAVLLNLYEAHLDYHRSWEHYIASKARIFTNMDASDDLFVQRQAQAYLKEINALPQAPLVTFQSHGLSDEQTGVHEGVLWLKGTKVIDVNDIALPGAHNLENIVAAVHAASSAGATPEGIAHVLTTFTGVAHRLQFVATVDGRHFYNDSKATNTLATKHALCAFTKPVVLLAGGLERGQSFEELKESMSHVRALVTFGETAARLEQLGNEVGIEHIARVDNVEKAVQTSYALSKSGDVILLSPACASWDQFKTFEERGDMFTKSVHTLN
ncbi:UDP-N-acetylmuramoyl-L-alanine--D-glutamate ligase [Bacillaceae bacterium SIJ1]|uniref:UDP-N-acetylmuramoyl-L-alanine--D-glutamate ligase n=1 Tax=Litoribacterium kuwaitense TaxID=1398745 RepID=UPI0013EA8FF6|nr:UDP-N-acetylmuramoyl-L-alanine--D-glutamate ligase [Litoribacterium kuwaitense]NGP44344.1 UDP-N-acetylmuramoyl-L-alanine--D-glutamate ligase [Litoribacterium kuwaitense]